MSLKLYTALLKKDINGKVTDVSLLEEGFSMPAFLFSLLWFLFYRMWRWSAIFIAIQIVLIKFVELDYIGDSEFYFMQILLSVFIALNARRWRSEYLQKSKGYERVDYLLARSKEEARVKFLESWHGESSNLSFDELAGADFT